MTAINYTLPGSPESILSGTKTTTIRTFSHEKLNKFLKNPTIQHYWQQRTPECRKIAEAELVSIRIITDFRYWLYNLATFDTAKNDGFRSLEDMRKWFEHHYTKEQIEKDLFMIIESKLKPFVEWEDQNGTLYCNFEGYSDFPELCRQYNVPVVV